jgi:hypothetical protein
VGFGHDLKRTTPAQSMESQSSRLWTAQSNNICADCVFEIEMPGDLAIRWERMATRGQQGMCSVSQSALYVGGVAGGGR